MGSKTISLDDEAYGILKAAKLPDESFSDVVKRTLAPQKPRLSDLAGILTPAEGRRLKRYLKDARAADAQAEARRDKLLWG